MAADRAAPLASLVVHYSRCGTEQLWCSELRASGASDGPEEAAELRRALAEQTGGVQKGVQAFGG